MVKVVTTGTHDEEWLRWSQLVLMMRSKHTQLKGGHIYVVHSISFQTFFVQAFKIVKNSVCFCNTFCEMTDKFL